MKYFILVALLTLPQITYGQAGGLVTCSGVDCDFCDFTNMVNKIEIWLISVSVLLAVMMLVYAGLMLATSAGDVSKATKAKELFTNVVIGLVTIMAAWMIVDTLLKALAGGDLGVWNRVGGSDCGQLFAPSAGVTGSSGGANTGWQTFVEEGKLDHDSAIGALNYAGVTVTSTNGPGSVYASCTGNGCTSLNNINRTTVAQVTNLCSMVGGNNCVVTGGTECGAHAGGAGGHCDGSALDIDDNPALKSWIETNLSYNNTTNSGYKIYKDSCGNSYMNEGNHWDVKVGGSVCSFNDV